MLHSGSPTALSRHSSVSSVPGTRVPGNAIKNELATFLLTLSYIRQLSPTTRKTQSVFVPCSSSCHQIFRILCAFHERMWHVSTLNITSVSVSEHCFNPRRGRGAIEKFWRRAIYIRSILFFLLDTHKLESLFQGEKKRKDIEPSREAKYEKG